MDAQKPSIGRIVHYTLTEKDADAINRRRTTGVSISERLSAGHWPAGAQAHIGNKATAGQVVPAMIVAVWPGPELNVNLRCYLDGTDDYWATTVGWNPAPEAGGYWNWPPRV